MTLAQLYAARKQIGEAEREFKQALALRSDLPVTWFGMARFYVAQGRVAEAREYAATAARLARRPASEYCLLGQIDLALHEPEHALEDYAKAQQAVLAWRGWQEQNRESFALIAEGRAAAYAVLRDWPHAIEAQQEATRRTPENIDRWETLADIYDDAGDRKHALEAHEHAVAISSKN